MFRSTQVTQYIYNHVNMYANYMVDREGGGDQYVTFFFCPSGHAAKILASGRKGEKKPLPLGGDCKCQMSAEVKKTLRAMVIGFLFFRVFSLQSFRPW